MPGGRGIRLGPGLGGLSGEAKVVHVAGLQRVHCEWARRGGAAARNVISAASRSSDAHRRTMLADDDHRGSDEKAGTLLISSIASRELVA